MTDDRMLLRAALVEVERGRSGGPAVRALVDYLVPVVQARVARVLLAHGRSAALGRLRAEVEDHVQTMFIHIFADEWKILRLWAPERGLNLRGWVGRFVQMRMIDELRSRARQPWRLQPMADDELERRLPASGPAEGMETEQLWQQARDKVMSQQGDRGVELFAMFFEDDLSTAEIRERTGLSADAVYQWRSRLRRAMGAALRDLQGAASEEAP